MTQITGQPGWFKTEVTPPKKKLDRKLREDFLSEKDKLTGKGESIMTKIVRKKHSRELKFKGAMAMIIGNKTINEISKEFGVHQSVLHRWKKDLLEKGL